MIGTEFTLTNKAHPERTITINDRTTDPAKFIALQSYPTFEADVRNDEIPKEGQHGIWDFFSFYGKRTITFEGVIVGANEADISEIRDLLVQVTALPAQPTTDDDGTVIISWTDPLDRDVQTEAKILTSPRFTRNMKEKYRLDFFITLKSANPAIESQDVTEVNGVRGYPMGGTTMPFMLPVELGTTYVNRFTVNNVGSAISDVTIRLYGGASFPINNPRISNLTTGVFMQINVELADETEYVEINTKEGTIVDQDGIDLSGNLEAGSGFPRLDIGENELFYTSDESVGELSPPTTHVDPDEVIETEHRFSVLL